MYYISISLYFNHLTDTYLKLMTQNSFQWIINEQMLVTHRRVPISVLLLVLEISDSVYFPVDRGHCNVPTGGEKNHTMCRKEKVGGEISFGQHNINNCWLLTAKCYKIYKPNNVMRKQLKHDINVWNDYTDTWLKMIKMKKITICLAVSSGPINFP